MEWPAFEWLNVDCLPDLIKLMCFLPQKEDNLRKRATKVLLDFLEYFLFFALPFTCFYVLQLLIQVVNVYKNKYVILTVLFIYSLS